MAEYDDFILHVASSYPIIWIDTCEYIRCINTYSKNVSKYLSHNIYSWDMITGISKYQNGSFLVQDENDMDMDAIEPIKFLENVCAENEENGTNNASIMFANDYHLFIKSPEIWRSLLNAAKKFMKYAQIFVIVSPIVDIPEEIKRYISVLDFKLPSSKIIEKRLEHIIAERHCIVEANDKQEIISSGTGLTLDEFDNAVFLSIVSHENRILPERIHEQKRQLIRKNNAMDIVKTNYGFERIIGLDNLKYFSKKMVGKRGSKGVLIVGVPGGGKSAFSKALGNETGRITISLDIGNLQGSLVGETEQKTKEALKIIDAMEPAILFIDEIEKHLAGVAGYAGDSGTSKRQGGQILRWLNDHTSDIYVVATCNNIDELPAEYLRAGRWDAIFYVGLPTVQERQELINLYKQIYGLTDINYPNIEGWTGAEIETLCRLTKSLHTNMIDAARFICPMIKVSKSKIDHMIASVKNITVPASIYV